MNNFICDVSAFYQITIQHREYVLRLQAVFKHGAQRGLILSNAPSVQEVQAESS